MNGGRNIVLKVIIILEMTKTDELKRHSMVKERRGGRKGDSHFRCDS